MSIDHTRSLRIGIDCRLGGIAHAGIGRYVSELLKQLIPLAQNVTWVLIVQTQEQGAELLAYIPGAYRATCEIHRVAARPYSLDEQSILPLALYKLSLDLLHVPHFNVPLLYFGKVVITVHDLLWHEQKGVHVTTLNPLIYWLKYSLYHLVTWRAISIARAIFVPSGIVKKTIEKFYSAVDTQKITVTHESISTTLVATATKMKQKSRQEKKLLYVGSLYPHKNVSLLLNALKKLPEYTLTIIGSRSVFRQTIERQITELGVTQQVSFLGRVTDETLAYEYATAHCVVQPSLSEGFGLTGLEAMAFETAVIASDIPIFHEIYQDGAIYCDPHSVDSLVSAVMTLQKPAIYLQVTKNGQKVQQQYSWKKLAQKTYETYLQVV